MDDVNRQAALRALPSIDALLRHPYLAEAVAAHGATAAARAARATLDDARAAIACSAQAPVVTDLARQVQARLTRDTRPNLRRVFNLTGTVLHTNLGRAPLADAAIQAMTTAAGAANVEYDLAVGKRGQRDALVEGLLCELTGAEAAVVVNNNAAAVLLLLNALAADREVIVSRGELIEIGDAFRVPDIMTRAGCRLCEVGTTNRTHAYDYTHAIGADTALLMTVWPSNYEIQGFTGKPTEAEIAAIAHANELPFAVDLGSGSLIEMADYGLPHEPTPAESLVAGADLVSFSGDKLLGGPQAGIIVGKRAFIDVIRRNPMKRALRCDKLILAALEATLRLYMAPETLQQRLPALRLLTRSESELAGVGERLLPAVRAALERTTDNVSLVACQSQIGSGSLPVDRLPSVAIRIAPPTDNRHPGRFLTALIGQLADLAVPVIGRTVDNALQLDLRCLEDEAGFVTDLQGLDRDG